jgi:SagB-type dehydrogenase family enzyme
VIGADWQCQALGEEPNVNDNIGKDFIERTKHHHLTRSDQSRGRPQPRLQQPYSATQPVLDLPDPLACPHKAVDVYDAIVERRSIRRYTQDPLSLAELSYLLWCTQGVKETLRQSATLRTVPSAGARHAFETYILVNRVTDLRAGLYRFLALGHKLIEQAIDPTMANKITAACFGQQFVKHSAVSFVWTAVPYRMNWRYGERGYRYLHLDVGHVCQNLYLSAESIQCGVCAIAAFDDDQMNRLLGIDGEQQFTIYVAAVGKTGI